eukprot:TRINITY_DN9959_c0_g1_i2.p1 TRINITY_DN9959_c0_g1~~TRINITY_DN9959_c0_g1_i2.p1  ORF type:complete len:639 (+),score=103.43 TRINITY_DN9959_c0_g1_i2:3-1919(+)
METENTDSMQSGKVIAQKYKLEDKIGQGSFGMIFKAQYLETSEICAIKLEKKCKHNSMLVRELKVLSELKDKPGYARLIGYGKEDDYNYVAMTYLGRNLDNLLKKCGGKFSMSCIVNIFEQCLTRIEDLHSKNLIHRDIKPENFVIGQNQHFREIFIIDFGLAKFYIDNTTKQHIPFYDKKGMIGTARYASINAHKGYEQSRRDDLEGLGYMMLYFAKSKLPWQSIVSDNKEEKYEKIKNMKMQYNNELLCEGLPKEFCLYFDHVKSLQFTDEPDYKYLRGLLHKIAHDKCLDYKNANDWDMLPEYRNRKNVTNIVVSKKKESQQIKLNSEEQNKQLNDQKKGKVLSNQEIHQQKQKNQSKKVSIKISSLINSDIAHSNTNINYVNQSHNNISNSKNDSNENNINANKNNNNYNNQNGNAKNESSQQKESIIISIPRYTVQVQNQYGQQNEKNQEQSPNSPNAIKDDFSPKKFGSSQKIVSEECQQQTPHSTHIQLQLQQQNQNQLICQKEKKPQSLIQKRQSLGSNFLLVPQKDNSTIQNPTCHLSVATSKFNNYGNSIDMDGGQSQVASFVDNTFKGLSPMNSEMNIAQGKQGGFSSAVQDYEDLIMPDVQSNYIDYHKKYPIHIMQCKKAYNMQQ